MSQLLCMVTWQQPATMSKCCGIGRQKKIFHYKNMGEAIVCSPLAWTLLFTLQKVMYLSIRWHSTADEELLSWKWLPNRTNKTLQNAQQKGLDSLPQASLWGGCFISHFPSKETKALASLMKCLTDRESEHRQSRTPALNTGRVIPQPSPSPPPTSTKAAGYSWVHAGISRCL